MNNLEQNLNLIFNLFSYQKEMPHVLEQFPKDNPPPDGTSLHGRFIEFFQRMTLSYAAEYAVKQSGGDILEIGCAEGYTTGILAQIAQKYNVKVYCIDPYNGEQEGTEHLYSKFKSVVEKYPNTISHSRNSSLSVDAKNFVSNKHFSFCYVDGLHTESAAYSDIILSHDSMKAGDVICVDDTCNLMERDAGKAMIKALNEGKFTLIDIEKAFADIVFSHKSWHFGVKN